MKKISLKILMVLTLALSGAEAYAAAGAASAEVAEGEDGPITKSAINRLAREAIDIMAADDPELHKQMSMGYVSHHNFLDTAEESSSFKMKRSVNPTVFDQLRTRYSFLTFYEDLSLIAGADKDKADSGLKMPARSAVDGGTFPEEGFVASGASMVRFFNKETGEISIINGLVEEDKDFVYFGEILARLQGASEPSQIDILISSLLFGPESIALGELLIGLGYTETQVKAYPQITEMTRIFRSEEVKEALTVPEIAAYNAAMDAYDDWQKEYDRLREAGESTEEHERVKPEHPEYPDVLDIIQTALIAADGSVKVLLDRGDMNLGMYYKPDLPKDDGRKWYDFSASKFEDPAEGDDETEAAASAADVEG